MSIITTIEGGIAKGASLAWQFTPGKVWVILGLLTALASLGAWGIHHERAIGRDQCNAAHLKADAKAQAQVDKTAKPQNDALEHELDHILEPLPEYLRRYEDKTTPADCPAVAYTRKALP